MKIRGVIFIRELFTIFLFVCSSTLFTQNRIITGTIIDKDKTPLSGAIIVVKGNKIGAVADFDGNFKLEVPKEIKVLTASFLGYKTQKVPIVNEKPITIIMLEDSESLDEIIIIGFGSVKKSDLTGAVSSISAKEITKVGTTSLDQALAGKAAGVLVTQTSGVPGAGASIRIRGITSTNGSEPLYVVDGIPIDNTALDSMNDQAQAGASLSPLATINPSDIESIEILKDASATAIYGSRGSNGVILITTKSGEIGKAKVQVSSEVGIAYVRKFYDIQDANEYWLTRAEAITNNDNNSFGNEQRLDSARAGLLRTTDWQDLIFRLGRTANHNVSISGGTNGIRYSFSTNLHNIEGTLKDTDFNRVATRLNLDAEVSDKFSIGTRINFTNVGSNQKSTTTDTDQAYGTNSVISRAILTSPTALFDATYNPDIDNEINFYSPLDALEANLYDNKINDFRGNVFVKYNLSKNIYFRSTFSYAIRQSDQTFYQLNVLPGATRSRNGWAKTQNSKRQSIVNQNTLNFRGKIGKKHSYNGVIGQSINTSEYFSVRTSNFGFSNDILTIYDPGSAEFQDDDDIRFSDNRLLSFFTRLNYKYNNKLLVTFTARADASTKFAENNKWGFFPAAAAAYNLHKEEFLKESPFSNLKLRISYGLSGNQSVTPYQSLSILTSDQNVFGDTSGNEFATAIYYPAQLPNKDLKWEYTAQFDTGIDFGLFNNKIKGTIEYYNKETKDLLFRGLSIPAHSGFITYTKNSGSIETNGFEFGFNAHIVSTNKFSWTLDGNIGLGTTKVVDLAEDYVNSGMQWGVVTDTQRLIIGEELGTFYGLKTAGIAQFNDFVEFQGLTEQQQIDKYNLDPSRDDYTLVSTLKNVAPTESTQYNPGAQLYEDLDGNGVINADDYQIIGQAQADATFGINNSFTIGNFDFSFFIDGQLGNEIANLMSLRTLAFGGNQQSTVVRNAWTAENPSTIYPRLDSFNNNDYNFSDRFIEDGSFIRLQNVTLGYNLPNKVVEKMGVSNLKIYASASNVFVLTKYSGFNPDVSLAGTSTQGIGHDNAAYPVPTTVRLGVNLQF